jgi:GT2 family glycosyltransferase
MGNIPMSGPPRPDGARACPSVAVVVPVHNKLSLTLRFLESFEQVDYPHYTVIVVDDGSTDGTAEALARLHPRVVRLPGDGRMWWTGGTNCGVRYALRAGYDYVLTINNDTIVSPDFLGRLVATAQAHPRSLVGARINFLDAPRKLWAIGSYAHWHTGIILQGNCHGGMEDDVIPRLDNPSPVQMLTGCGTLVPADCYHEIGLYDERWCPQYHADSEFTLRAQQHGYRILVDIQAVIWNDVDSTSMHKNLFSRRSPWFWRPLVAILWRYCPPGHRLRCLWHHYATTYFYDQYHWGKRQKQRVQARWRRLLRLCQLI